MQSYVYGEKRDLPQGFESYLDPGSTAVISIDMHAGHLEPDCPCPAPRAREIVEPINRFHGTARALGIPVIHVKSVLRRNGVDDVNGNPSAWRKTFPLYIGAIPNADEHAIEGTRWTEFVTEVLPDDLIVATKKRLSPFYATDLDFLLRQLEVKAVILNGGMTDCCVLNAAFDASNLGYRVVAAQDLSRGTNRESEQAALRIVSLHLGLVMEAADIVSEWQAVLERHATI